MVDKPSARLTKTRREKTQINDISNKKEAITAGTSEIQKTRGHILIYMALSWKI